MIIIVPVGYRVLIGLSFCGSGTNWCYASRVPGNVLGNTYGLYVDVICTSYICTPCMNWVHRGIIHTHRWYLQRTLIRTLRVAEVVCVSVANCRNVSAPMHGARKGFFWWRTRLSCRGNSMWESISVALDGDWLWLFKDIVVSRCFCSRMQGN